MPRGHSVNVEAFHDLLHRRTDRHGRLLLKQASLAREFGLTKFTMSRLISRMIGEQRMRQLSNSRQNRGYFIVEDPEVWRVVHVRDEGDDEDV